MAVGNTAEKMMKRNTLVRNALRKVRAVKRGEQLTADMMLEGINALNEILREEDHDLSGSKTPLMAVNTAHLSLTSGIYIYNAAEGLPEDIYDLISVYYRDLSGDDTMVDILLLKAYESLPNKNETGDVSCVFLKTEQTKAEQTLYIYPGPISTGTVDVVTGSDGMTYRCIMPHTSTTDTKPVTGSSYRLFWEAGGSDPSAWADDTDYTAGTVLRIVYKRPLFDFTDPSSDPDLPLGWSNYLMWRLAILLSPEYEIDLEERNWFKTEAATAKALIFPSLVPETTDFHDKAEHF